MHIAGWLEGLGPGGALPLAEEGAALARRCGFSDMAAKIENLRDHLRRIAR